MRNLRFLSTGLRLTSIATLLLCLLCGLMFYAFYFKWISLFEDGRYFDPNTGVVYHDTSVIFGILSVAFLLIAVALWFAARKVKARHIS